jgi:outer membrane protein
MKMKALWMLALIVTVTVPCPGIAAEPLTLEESVDIALKNSLTIHYAKEGVEVATAGRREAVTGFLPKFNTS